jgi:hypothetical protein
MPSILKQLIFCPLLLLAACSSKPYGYNDGDLIVDMAGVDPVAYEQDLANCRGYADQVQKGQKVAKGAAGSAAAGGVIGGIASDSSKGAARGAGVGATLGVIKGLRRGNFEERKVLRSCMIKRGYTIYN